MLGLYKRPIIKGFRRFDLFQNEQLIIQPRVVAHRKLIAYIFVLDLVFWICRIFATRKPVSPLIWGVSVLIYRMVFLPI
jgi:hypothetical protein